MPIPIILYIPIISEQIRPAFSPFSQRLFQAFLAERQAQERAAREEGRRGLAQFVALEDELQVLTWSLDRGLRMQ